MDAILSNPAFAVVVVVGIFAILAGFFRHLLIKVVIVLVVEVILFILFPNLLVYLAVLVASVRQAIS